MIHCIPGHIQHFRLYCESTCFLYQRAPEVLRVDKDLLDPLVQGDPKEGRGFMDLKDIR